MRHNRNLSLTKKATKFMPSAYLFLEKKIEYTLSQVSKCTYWRLCLKIEANGHSKIVTLSDLSMTLHHLHSLLQIICVITEIIKLGNWRQSNFLRNGPTVNNFQSTRATKTQIKLNFKQIIGHHDDWPWPTACLPFPIRFYSCNIY